MNVLVLRMRSPRGGRHLRHFVASAFSRSGERICELGSTVSEHVESLSSLVNVSAL
jgi:hypothetical protein